MECVFPQKFKKRAVRIGLALLAVGMMACCVLAAANVIGLEHPRQAALMGALLYAVALIPFLFRKELPLSQLALAAVVIAAFVFLRVCLFPFRSGDYNGCLSKWVEQMRPLSLTEAMQARIGDYNMPYLYILFLISRFPVSDLLAIKFVSCLFDILLAFGLMELVALKVPRFEVRLAAYGAALACPTVFLNSACWGQCDAAYGALCLWMLYCVLRGKGRGAVICWTLAFAFKLQAVFALPLLVIGLFIRRVRLRELLWLPAAYLVTLLPALLCGRSFPACVDIYFKQVAEYQTPKIFHNVSSLWCLTGENVPLKPFTLAGVFLAGGAVLLFLYFCFLRRVGFQEEQLIQAFFLCVLLIPFLLPEMHERYFYLADIASLALFFRNPPKWYVPLTVILVSYNGYCHYLMGGEYLFPLSCGAVALLLLLAASLREFFSGLGQAGRTA